MNKEINIALITDENYSLMTCMCINDIILNKKNKTLLNFYILLNNVSDNNKKILAFFNKKENVNISLIDVTNICKEFEIEYNKINSKANFSGHVSGTSFIRIFLPQIINKLNKIIYLDQDIYVNGDLQKFYDIDIEKYLLAAPIDTFSLLMGKQNPSYSVCQKSFDNKKYIQAGQILMNLKKMREFDFSNKCVSFLKEYLPPNKDMDVINAIAYDFIKPLDQSFCVPRAAIELAKNGYVSSAFLDIRFYNSILNTGYSSIDELIKKGLIWHFYGNKDRDMQLCPELMKMFFESRSRLLKALNPSLENENKSFLILHEEYALGDSLVITNFFKDFHEQYPDYKLYYKVTSNHPYWTTQKEQIFRGNPNIKIWNGEYVNKIIRYKCGDYFMKSNKEQCVMNHVIYDIFEKNTGIKVVQNTLNIDVYPTNEEIDNILNKFEIKNDKPICLICDGYHPISNTVKYAGTKKYQNIIDALKNEVNFIQVGDTKGGYIHNRLDGVIDLIDKTDIRDLFALMWHTSFVITGIHALLHIASMKSKNFKNVYVFYGCRECSKYYETYLNLDHTKFHLFGNNLDKFQKCLHGDFCCLKDVTFQNEYNKDRKLCNYVKVIGNEVIAECMNDIDENQIINDIKSKSFKG